MKYNFDQKTDRTRTNASKWDETHTVFGADVLPLWVADMDFPCPPAVVNAMIARAHHPIFGYPGKPNSLFESVGGWMNRRFDVDLKTEWMTTVPGVVSGLTAAIEAFTKPGDKVIIQSPVYPPFFNTVRNRGRQVLENALIERKDGSYAMNFDELRTIIDKRTKMLVLCSPHNPVGRLWTREELQELADICIQHKVLIISDEIHADLVLHGKHVPICTLSHEIAQHCVTFISPSKTFNVAGLFSSIAIAENPNLLHELNIALENLSMKDLNVFGIEAMQAAYNEGEEWLEELLVYLRGNAAYIHEFLKEKLPKINMLIPEATYLGWMDFRELGLSHDNLRHLLIHDARLGLNDGAMFGKAGEGFQRINFGCPRSLLEEAMQRLERTFAHL